MNVEKAAYMKALELVEDYLSTYGDDYELEVSDVLAIIEDVRNEWED